MSQVPVTKVLENGTCFKIAPEKPEIYDKIQVGKLIVEGKNIYKSDESFIKDRRKMSFQGLILISLIIYNDFSLHKDIKITNKGLPIQNSIKVDTYFKENFLQDYIKLSKEEKSSDEIIADLVKKILRGYMKTNLGKKPEVKVHIIRL